MTNKITLNHPEAHEKLTARLFWKRTSENGLQDAGNVAEWTDASTRTLVTRSRAGEGARFVNDEQADVCHEAYTCKLDERIPAQEQLIKLARQLTDTVQEALEGATATITGVVQDKWFTIGAYNIANVAVVASISGAVVEGDDYELDRENGRIRVIPGESIGNGETLNLTFDEPGIVFETIESQYNPLFYCDFVIEEYNQFHRMWLRRSAFKGYMNVTSFPSHTGNFGVYDVKITPSGPVTTLKRPEAQTLPSHVDGGVAANSSSSSSQSSSSSYSRSSSSS